MGENTHPYGSQKIVNDIRQSFNICHRKTNACIVTKIQSVCFVAARYFILNDSFAFRFYWCTIEWRIKVNQSACCSNLWVWVFNSCLMIICICAGRNTTLKTGLMRKTPKKIFRRIFQRLATVAILRFRMINTLRKPPTIVSHMKFTKGSMNYKRKPLIKKTHSFVWSISCTSLAQIFL